MQPLAIIPARGGSKGIPNKNFRRLGDRSLVGWAAKAGREAGCTCVCTTDLDGPEYDVEGGLRWILRDPALAQDDTPMVAVVEDVLAWIPGPDDQIIVLLQPTQPFRTAAHVKTAIALLESIGLTDSVVSVVETTSPEKLYRKWGEWLEPWEGYRRERRQDCVPAYRPDGTVYAFRRATVAHYGNLYGEHVRALVIPAEESCELDTLLDWERVQERWTAQQAWML